MEADNVDELLRIVQKYAGSENAIRGCATLALGMRTDGESETTISIVLVNTLRQGLLYNVWPTKVEN